MKTNTLFLYAAICLILNLCVHASYAQEKLEYSNSYDLIIEGIKHKRQGEYEKAVAEYEKVHEGDTLFFKYALPEKMTCYGLLEDYEKVMELGDKYWHFRHKLPTEFYLSYGTALDKTEKFKEARTLYRKILKEYPLNYSLWYNYGVSLTLDDKYEQAYDVFKRTIEVNPLYDRAHYQIAMYALRQQQTSKALMALNMYLTLGADRRNTLAELSYANTVSNSKYRNEEDYEGSKGVDIGDNGDYKNIDQLLHNYVAIDEKYETDSDLDFDLVKQSHLLFSSLNDVKIDENDFWHTTYVEFYKQLMQAEQFEGWTYLISNHIENDDMKKIVEKNQKDALEALNWSKNQIDENRRRVDLSFVDLGRVKVLRNEEKSYYTYALGNFDYNAEEDKIAGDVTFYNQYGRVSAKGTFDENYRRTGNWSFYFPNGYLKETVNYDAGTRTDSSFIYADNGLIKFKLYYEDGNIENDVMLFENGILDRIIPYTAGEVDGGRFTKFHTIGSESFSYDLKGGKAHGPYKSYYNTGELLAEGTYDEGDYTGKRTTYHRNGKINIVENYSGGEKNGSYESYFDNGQLRTKGEFKDGNKIGEWKSYYREGIISLEQSFDEKGKLTGHEKKYTLNGDLLYDRTYKKGELDAYIYYDSSGTVIAEAERKWKKLDYKAFHQNRVLEIEGKLKKGEREGEWKTYTPEGSLLSVRQYDEGKLTGRYKKYFPSGNLERTYPFDDKGDATGYYEDNFRNDKLYRQGFVNSDQFNGPWRYYYRDGMKRSSTFFIDGDKSGFSRYYAVDGTLIRTEFHEKGLKKFSVYHDTAGAPLDTVYNIPEVKKVTLKRCKTCSPYVEAQLHNTVYHGEGTYYYPNGNKLSHGNFFNDNRHGDWKFYYVNGALKSEGEYAHGNKIGKWNHYYKSGKIKEEYRYLDGKLHGLRQSFDEQGNVTFEAPYREGNLHGTVKYFVGSDHDHSREYFDGTLMSLSYRNNGETIVVPVKNGTVKAEITWDNGKTARIFSFKNGYLHGPYKKFYKSGKLADEYEYRNDWLEGEYREYYENGNPLEKSTLKNGKLTGTATLYHSNGNKSAVLHYIRGSRHGICEFYNENGELTEKRNYFNGNIIDIE